MQKRLYRDLEIDEDFQSKKRPKSPSADVNEEIRELLQKYTAGIE